MRVSKLCQYIYFCIDTNHFNIHSLC